MPHSSFSFTTVTLRDLKTADKQQWFTDRKQQGLQLCVLPSGKKRFYFYGRVDGKPKRKTIGGFPDVTLQEARKTVRDLLTQRDRGALPAVATSPTFADAYAARRAAAVKKGNKTLGEDDRRYDTRLKPFHARRLHQITRAEVRQFHDKVGRDYPYEANRYLALIRVVFNHAIADDDLNFEGPNPTEGIAKFPEESRERYLKKEELDRFLESLDAENQFYQDLFTVLLFTGARKRNVLRMKWSEVDLDFKVWTFESKNKATHGKTNLPLAPDVVDILARRQESKGRNEYVFPSPRRPWTCLKDITIPWRRIANRAELEDVRLHDLRRTLGSWQINAGASLEVIGKSLGHAPNSRATQVYARLAMDPVRASVDAAVAAMRGEQ